MNLTKKQIERAVEINDATDKAKLELGKLFNDKTAASITFHLIYPKGRGLSPLTDDKQA